jgi:hypothetical protein
MKTLYRLGLISVLGVIVLLLDYCTAGSGVSMLPPDEHDELELYTLMGFEQAELDW